MTKRKEPDMVSLCGDYPPPTDEPKQDVLRWKAIATVERYDDNYTAEEIVARGIQPVSVDVYEDNLVTTVGLARVLDRLIGVSVQAADNTHTFLGVGNSATAATVGQTDLQAGTGGSNRQWKGMDATYPSRASSVVTFKATYTSGEAAFAWNEWALEVDNGTVSPGTAALSTGTQKMINRRTPSGGMGTKGAVTWTLTVTLTLA